ncbi:MAG: serine/threonine-protein kinase [Thermoanaerobaculia bacterium]
MTTTAEPSNEQRQYGEYVIESVLGRGAMGMVYLARDKRIGRKVALKTVQVEQQFDDDADANEFYLRLQREAEVCGSMQHPNIVTLYEPGYTNTVISYLATEYIDGESLRQRLKRSKPLPLAEAVRIGEDILRGLVYAHTKGIIHRDIKPANILLTLEGQAKIADFGIARPVDSSLTAAGSMLGTPNYMSPEQVRCGEITTRSDLFSVGVVLYEMLTGQKPFTAPELTGILRNVVELVPPLASQVNAEVPEPLARFVARLFEKKPEDRIDSAATALAELQKLKAQIAPVKLEVIEELSPDMAIASATPKADRSMHSSTDRNFDDVTPPVTSVHGTGAIPPTLFWAVVSPLAAILIIAGTVIRLNSDPRPSVTIPATKQAEFVAKRHALDEARQLFAAAQYEQSVNAYDDYLRRYPNSITAQNGRNEAAKALDAAKSKTSVTARASAPKKTPEKEQPQPSRFKRFMNKITGKKK